MSRENNEIGMANENTDIEPANLMHPDFSEKLSNIYSLVPRELSPKMGLEFETEEEAYQFYLRYAKQVGFGIRRSKSHNDKFGKLISRIFCCSAEGKRRADKRDLYVRTPRAETRCGCEARMKIHSLETGKFQVIQFVEEHNHYLSCPNMTHLHRSHRKISSTVAMKIEMDNGVGIPPKASPDLMVRQASGRINLGFIPEDYKNYLRSKRTRDMKKGDTGEVLEYLQKMQLEDPNFFYAIQVDEDDLITNIFWSDAKMRNDYLDFGDVVCFDTTYRESGECRPLAIFVGVNNHKQTAVFGVALLYDETVLTFEWLFDTFTRAMSEKKPKTILTYQDAAMAKALASKWSETHHRLCIWQIFQNAAIHLSNVFSRFKDFSRDFSSCIYDFEQEKDFFAAWDEMLRKYGLQENAWLKQMFDIKENWSLVYGREMFCADITTTQRSESMNSIVKRYASYQHNSLQFFIHFQRLISDRRYDELKADFKANTSIPALPSPVQILKHAATVYTPEVFKCFQDQWNLSHDCSFCVFGEVGTVTEYEITPVGKHYSHIVIYDTLDEKAHCSCSKFEFTGILCSHVLKVFTLRNIFRIPSQYILKRWTRKAKTGYLGDKSSNANESELDPKTSSSLRYKDLCALTIRLVTRAAERGDTYKIVKDQIPIMLETVDNLLQDEGLTLEENPILQGDKLGQCSNFGVEASNQSETDFGESSQIRGIKAKKKPSPGKRLKSCLRKIIASKRRKLARQPETVANMAFSTPKPSSNIQDYGKNCQNVSNLSIIPHEAQGHSCTWK